MAALLVASAACAQWPLLRLLGVQLGLFVPLSAGACVLGAAFLLTWAGEVAELDISSGLAVAILAVVAVLPEYAVDVYFAWRAGRDPSYTALATANMTGSNRLLIGLGWAAVLLAGWLGRGQKTISLERGVASDFSVLALATLYAFVIPLKGTLSLVDFAVFSGLFLYFVLGLGGEHGEPELAGPAALYALLPAARRRAAVVLTFLFSAGAIYLAAGPFAEGLVAIGERHGLDRFLLIQWVAPLASEAPEFIVAALFASKGRGSTGLRVLISSKVNQWTLLVGMLPAVYCVSARSLAPMPLDTQQDHELLLTAAQSFFALCALLDFRFSWREAAALAVLFVPQPFFTSGTARLEFSALYIAGGVALFFLNGGFPRVNAIVAAAKKSA